MTCWSEVKNKYVSKLTVNPWIILCKIPTKNHFYYKLYKVQLLLGYHIIIYEFITKTHTSYVIHQNELTSAKHLLFSPAPIKD